MIVREQIRKGLINILNRDPNSIILGEDIKDPYGGAFKITEGLSKKFKKRIIQTPISEGGFVGMATGMTFYGINPVVEIMFNDFLTLTTDILINSASKFPELSKENKKYGNILIRTPGGGGRGYGPIHSQNLEKLFFGWPNIEIFAPNIVVDPNLTLSEAYFSQKKVKIFIEDKLDYTRNILSKNQLEKDGFLSKNLNKKENTTILSNSADMLKSDFVVISYGGTLNRILKACKEALIEKEITSTIIATSKVYPIEDDLKNFLKEIDKKILIIEDGYSSFGWGSYLLTELIKINKKLNLRDIKILGPKNTVIPANITKEKEHFIQEEDILNNLGNF